MSFEIQEETATVKVYSWICAICQRRFHHVHRKTLEHNVEEHLAQKHGEQAEKRHQIEEIKKKLAAITRHLNRRYRI